MIDRLTRRIDPPTPWSWEVRVPELETSVFVVPGTDAKNGIDRYVVLNRIARSVIEECRGVHDEFVFTDEGHPQTRMNNSGRKAARRRAAARTRGRARRSMPPCPAGFRSIRVHDLKHTFGHRLRAAGVCRLSNRQNPLGHKAAHVATHYAAADIGNLIAASETIYDFTSRKSPATVYRAVGRSVASGYKGSDSNSRTPA